MKVVYLKLYQHQRNHLGYFRLSIYQKLPPMTVLKSNNDQFELDKNCLTSDLLFMSGNNSDGSYSRVQQKKFTRICIK